jgi:hypothetical protein
MQNRQTVYFPENDCSIVTGLCPNGEYGAYLETDDGRVRGYGHTRMAAIADLVEAIGGDDEEEIDHQAVRFDHARDLRKQGAL